MRIILFAAIGAASGAAAAELLDLLPSDQAIQIFRPIFIIPGLFFGAIVGVALRHLGHVSATGAVAYAIASTLSNAAATYLAMVIFLVHPNGTAVLGVTGFIAGAMGGGLLAGATALLIRHFRWPLIAAGAVLGAFLPLIDLHSIVGPFLFYAIWQGGYAATLAAILPRTASAATPSTPVK